MFVVAEPVVRVAAEVAEVVVLASSTFVTIIILYYCISFNVICVLSFFLQSLLVDVALLCFEHIYTNRHFPTIVSPNAVA